jgi:hypothetical protein
MRCEFRVSSASFMQPQIVEDSVENLVTSIPGNAAWISSHLAMERGSNTRTRPGTVQRIKSTVGNNFNNPGSIEYWEGVFRASWGT